MSDLSNLLTLAQLSNLAYMDDVSAQDAGCEALGFTKVCPRYETEDDRALLVRNYAHVVLVLCGTRFSDGNWHELWDDDDLLPIGVGAGAHVMTGFYSGLAELSAWVLASVPHGTAMELTGHSLGGARAHLMPLFADFTSITSFGAPKCGNKTYWKQFTAPLVRVVHERDFAPGWPALSEFHQPDPMLWLHNGALVETTEAAWPGGISLKDHAVENYIAALQALATPKGA